MYQQHEYQFVREYSFQCQLKQYENNQKIVDEITVGLQTKKFAKNKHEIVYDIELMEITSIDCLEYDKKEGLWMVEW